MIKIEFEFQHMSQDFSPKQYTVKMYIINSLLPAGIDN